MNIIIATRLPGEVELTPSYPYVICAQVDPDEPLNAKGKPELVGADISWDDEGVLSFEVPGKVGDEQARTTALCLSLLKAGYLEFAIFHYT